MDNLLRLVNHLAGRDVTASGEGVAGTGYNALTFTETEEVGDSVAALALHEAMQAGGFKLVLGAEVKRQYDIERDRYATRVKAVLA